MSRGTVLAGKHLSITHSEESPPDALSVQVSSMVGYSRVVGTPCGLNRIDIRLRCGAWHIISDGFELIPNEAYAGLSAASLGEHEFIYNFLGSELGTAGVASVIKI